MRLGVGIDEYNARWDSILQKLGGALSSPSGWAPEGNYHSCVKPAIYVPHPERLNDDQRQTIIEEAERVYSKVSPLGS